MHLKRDKPSLAGRKHHEETPQLSKVRKVREHREAERKWRNLVYRFTTTCLKRGFVFTILK